MQIHIFSLRTFILRLIWVNFIKYKLRLSSNEKDISFHMRENNIFRDIVAVKFTEALIVANTQVESDKIIHVDVGANYGKFFTNYQDYTKLKIIAFEPNVELHFNYGDNFQWNAVAVSDNNDDLSFYIDARHTGSSSLIRQSNHTKIVTVPCVTLDDFFGETDCQICIIKIDVEGSELQVLKGASSIIEKHKPILTIETDRSKTDTVMQMLPNYRFYEIVVPGLDYQPNYFTRFFKILLTLIKPNPKIYEVNKHSIGPEHINNLIAIPSDTVLPQNINLYIG